jgi:type II secretion system protein I
VTTLPPSTRPGVGDCLQTAGDRVGKAGAFTLLEVLVAMGLFFLAVFAILDATMQGLRAARSLERNVPDAGLVLSQFMQAQRVDVEQDAGDFEEPYEGFRWSWERQEIATNGLYEVVCVIEGDVEGRPYRSSTTAWMWRPDWSRPQPGLRR